MMMRDFTRHQMEVRKKNYDIGFWDPDGYYFNRDGYDKHGIYFNSVII
jgi:hypothetical protein